MRGAIESLEDGEGEQPRGARQLSDLPSSSSLFPRGAEPRALLG